MRLRFLLFLFTVIVSCPNCHSASLLRFFNPFYWLSSSGWRSQINTLPNTKLDDTRNATFNASDDIFLDKNSSSTEFPMYHRSMESNLSVTPLEVETVNLTENSPAFVPLRVSPLVPQPLNIHRLGLLKEKDAETREEIEEFTTISSISELRLRLREETTLSPVTDPVGEGATEQQRSGPISTISSLDGRSKPDETTTALSTDATTESVTFADKSTTMSSITVETHSLSTHEANDENLVTIATANTAAVKEVADTISPDLDRGWTAGGEVETTSAMMKEEKLVQKDKDEQPDFPNSDEFSRFINYYYFNKGVAFHSIVSEV